MKKIWLSLLLFLLPLQMSWAAVHFCDESVHTSQAAQLVETAVDQAQGTGQDMPATQDALADACCSAAHGCHGLHSLMGPCEQPTLAGPEAQPVAASPPALADQDASGRIDRPQWLAA